MKDKENSGSNFYIKCPSCGKNMFGKDNLKMLIPGQELSCANCKFRVKITNVSNTPDSIQEIKH